MKRVIVMAETSLLLFTGERENVIKKNVKENWGAYHLHGKPGNSSWKIKWYASFHLEYF